ncbi:MAG: kinase/pyrophosphorylase, partial [Lysobacterales bacterium]
MSRTVFFISDGTAITVETLGHSLLTQFAQIQFTQVRIPFVTDEAAALDAVRQINQAYERDNARPLIFNTIVDDKLSGIVRGSRGVMLDLFAT